MEQRPDENAKTKQLSPEELGQLAAQLVRSSDQEEIPRIEQRITEGFYGQSAESCSVDKIEAVEVPDKMRSVLARLGDAVDRLP